MGSEMCIRDSAIRYRNSCQAHTPIEGTRPDRGDTIRDRDARQFKALSESAFPDARDALTHHYTRQAGAFIEGPISDASDTVRYRDARQIRTAIKGLNPDAGDRITFDSRGYG